ncbi:MAG TPA: adenylate/guanylate cyclase domain-containing protein [Candidatus Sulfotelmatobacter sp.]|jgi:adenylate cyclase|nr:adenylate/guanylate cyclase domain-containing protein [Candidatus Sulfotelmatobacter sp.]
MTENDPSWVWVRYPEAPGGEARVLVPAGTSVLAASLTAGIPHAAVCGGRGRCSSCRVKVLEGAENQPPPDPGELATLRPLLARDPSVRLACRLRLQADIAVAPQMPKDVSDCSPDLAGRLVDLTVMFVDLRGYSRMAARMHPFDVVFTLNRYFELVVTAVEQAGGRVDKFIGDGVMAVFGLAAGAQEAGRMALQAAWSLSRMLPHLNEELSAELAEPLRIGIGLHSGPAIWGRFGWGGEGQRPQETAIGDVVNIASRLEGMTKTLSCQLVMSETVALSLGEERKRFPRLETGLPNYEGEIAVYQVADAADLF